MRVTAIVGSYHRGGMVDTAVDEILSVVSQAGAEVRKIDLLDAHIEFCTNCQSCVQTNGVKRGKCVIDDDLDSILDSVDACDALILASPMNFWTVTALMKRFIERLIVYGFWPWATASPSNRIKRGDKRAIVVISSAAPAVIARYMTNMAKLLKSVARLLGANKVDVLMIGLARHKPDSELAEKHRLKARKLAAKLVAAGR